MAGVFSTTIAFASGNAVTPAKLNQIATGSSFTADAIFGTTLAVTGGQLKVGTITSSEMGAASVGTTALINECVTAGKIANGNLTTDKYANLSITGEKMANGDIPFSKFHSGAAATASNMKLENGSKIVTPNIIKHSPVAAKAHGTLNISASRSVESTYYNFGSITRVSATETRVNIAANMATAAYCVQATYEDSSGGTGAVSVYDRNIGYFRVTHPTEGAGKKVHLTVFGKLE